MKLLRIGALPGRYSMLLFHALARMGVESLVIVTPVTPLVSVGYFQGLDGVDMHYCRQQGIPVMRRELGGGTTLLDRNQIFYQVILKKDNPRLPASVEALYRELSRPVIATYAALGIPTYLKPVNDIMTVRSNKKIAGEGGGDIGACMVFVGGILLDFNYELMSRILRVPDEKFRDKVYKTMAANLTTIKGELGFIPDREQINDLLITNFSGVLGELQPAGIPAAAWDEVARLEQQLCTPEFLEQKNPRYDGIKINAAVEVKRRHYKAPGGLITTDLVLKEGRIAEIKLTGDFTFYPARLLPDLEQALTGIPCTREAIYQACTNFVNDNNIEIPGVEPEHLTRAIAPEQG